MPHHCAVCDKTVRKNQHAISCDGCQLWTHRTCVTDLSKSRYREICENEEDFPFTCVKCREQIEINSFDQTMGHVNFDLTLNSEVEENMEVDDNIRVPDLSDINISALSLPEQTDELERSIADATLIDPPTADIPDNVFTLVDTGSQKGKKKLVDSYGFSYVVRVKEQAVQNIYKSGASIVEDAQQAYVDPDRPGGRDNHSTLVRMANRTRELLRPKEPTTLDFELDEDFLPDDFLRLDVENKGERHLVFATDRQLQHLSRSCQWFLDGTFKIVKRPFHQLMTIHAFVRSGSVFKLMPLVFVVMSRRRTSDYFIPSAK